MDPRVPQNRTCTLSSSGRDTPPESGGDLSTYRDRPNRLECRRRERCAVERRHAMITNRRTFIAIMKKFGMNVTPVVDLWPKLGETTFTSHVAALQQAKPDFVFSSFWSRDASISMKQAHAAGLTQGTKFIGGAT